MQNIVDLTVNKIEPKVMTASDDHKRTFQHTKTMHKPLFQTGHAGPRNPAIEEAPAMKAWNVPSNEGTEDEEYEKDDGTDEMNDSIDQLKELEVFRSISTILLVNCTRFPRVMTETLTKVTK